eukprot:scaffold7947_cov403-Prasinococcus_capsulatus_cf.AAC.2
MEDRRAYGIVKVSPARGGASALDALPSVCYDPALGCLGDGCWARGSTFCGKAKHRWKFLFRVPVALLLIGAHLTMKVIKTVLTSLNERDPRSQGEKAASTKALLKQHKAEKEARRKAIRENRKQKAIVGNGARPSASEAGVEDPGAAAEEAGTEGVYDEQWDGEETRGKEDTKTDGDAVDAQPHVRRAQTPPTSSKRQRRLNSQDRKKEFNSVAAPSHTTRDTSPRVSPAEQDSKQASPNLRRKQAAPPKQSGREIVASSSEEEAEDLPSKDDQETAPAVSKRARKPNLRYPEESFKPRPKRRSGDGSKSVTAPEKECQEALGR